MRTLILDIETRPNLAYVWECWEANVPPSMMLEHKETMCFSWQWHGEDGIHFTRRDLGKTALELFSEADAVVTYNGDKFDLKHLNTNIVHETGQRPPKYTSVDLYKVVRKHFAYPRNSLAYVASRWGLGGKLETGGFELWKGCLADDPQAWMQMRSYNTQDVVLTGELFEKLLPWIDNLPHAALLNGDPFGCRSCGGQNLHKRGYRYARTRRYQRYQCQDCSAWSTDTRNCGSVSVV